MTASDLNQAEVRTLLATDIPDQLNATAASRISTDPIAETGPDDRPGLRETASTAAGRRSLLTG